MKMNIPEGTGMNNRVIVYIGAGVLLLLNLFVIVASYNHIDRETLTLLFFLNTSGAGAVYTRITTARNKQTAEKTQMVARELDQRVNATSDYLLTQINQLEVKLTAILDADRLKAEHIERMRKQVEELTPKAIERDHLATRVKTLEVDLQQTNTRLNAYTAVFDLLGLKDFVAARIRAIQEADTDI